VDVIAPGTAVTLDHGRVEALVAQTCIRMGRSVWYQVVWWNGPDRKAEWVEADEVTPAARGRPLRVGFLNGSAVGPSLAERLPRTEG
jgi:hypothetical protein